MSRTYKPQPGETIQKTAQSMTRIANEFDDGVVATFNDIIIGAMPGGDPKAIVAYYMDESKRRHEAYISSDAYKLAQQKREDEERSRNQALEMTLETAPENLSLRDESAWNRQVEINRDPYGAAIIQYAGIWARLMEREMKLSGCSVADCAERLSRTADTEGITGFMYGCAVSILSQCWLHGEDLRVWHQSLNSDR